MGNCHSSKHDKKETQEEKEHRKELRNLSKKLKSVPILEPINQSNLL